MKKKMKITHNIFSHLFAAFVLLSMPGCKAEKPTSIDSIEIYQQIIRNIYLVDNSFGKPVDIQYLYILKATDDGVGDSRIEKLPSENIPNEIIDGICTKLSDLSPEIVWINTFDEVLDRSVSLNVKDGAIVTLGNIHYESNKKAYVSISIYFAGLAASGRTYILEKDKTTWKITGDTGERWVS